MKQQIKQLLENIMNMRFYIVFLLKKIDSKFFQSNNQEVVEV